MAVFFRQPKVICSIGSVDLFKKRIKNIAGEILYYTLNIFSILFKDVYIGRIYSSRIGHLCFNSENTIQHYSRMGRKFLLILILDKKIANSYVLSLISQIDGVIFLSHKWTFLYSLLFYARQGKRIIIPWDIQHNEFNTFSATRRLVEIDQNEVKALKLKIQDYCGASDHICLHNRDNSYLKMKNLEDGNTHDYRNFEFSSFKSACLSLMQMGVCPVRIGEIVEIAEHDFEYFDLSGPRHSDMLDVIAIGSAKFLVTGNTGLSQIARLCRIPILVINYCPFRVEDFHALTPGSVVVPKKIYDLKKQRFLSLNELINTSRNFDIHYKGNYYKDNGLLVIDNSEDEINRCILGLYNSLNNPDDSNKINLPKYIDSTFVKYTQELNISISPEFLEANPFLLDRV